MTTWENMATHFLDNIVKKLKRKIYQNYPATSWKVFSIEPMHYMLNKYLNISWDKQKL